MGSEWMSHRLDGYISDLRESIKKGTLPPRAEFRELLGLGEELKAIVHHAATIESEFGELLKTFHCELPFGDPGFNDQISFSTHDAELAFKVIKLRVGISGNEAMIELSNLGFRPAGLGEALFLIKAFPDFLKKEPILVLHFPYESEGPSVVFLGYEGSSKRPTLRFRDMNMQWRAPNFLSVRDE